MPGTWGLSNYACCTRHLSAILEYLRDCLNSYVDLKQLHPDFKARQTWQAQCLN